MPSVSRLAKIPPALDIIQLIRGQFSMKKWLIFVDNIHFTPEDEAAIAECKAQIRDNPDSRKSRMGDCGSFSIWEKPDRSSILRLSGPGA